MLTTAPYTPKEKEQPKALRVHQYLTFGSRSLRRTTLRYLKVQTLSLITSANHTINPPIPDTSFSNTTAPLRDQLDISTDD